jgi:hypothetical protein
MWFYSFSDFGMHAGAVIDESDQMGQCVTLIHSVRILVVSKGSVVRQVLVKLVPVLYHATIRAVSMLGLQSDIETKRFLSDSCSVTPTGLFLASPAVPKTITKLSQVRVWEHVRGALLLSGTTLQELCVLSGHISNCVPTVT